MSELNTISAPAPSRALNKTRVKPMGLNFTPSERPVIELLKLLQDNPTDQGAGFLIETGEKWKEVVAAVKANGGKGELTLKLVIANEGHRVAFVGDYTIKKPKAKRKPMSGYATEDGRLTLSDPDQFEMEFSDAS